MLNEKQRLIEPSQVHKQVDWNKLEAVVILGLNKKGEKNVLHMSSITIEELALLTSQLQAHLTYLLGPMDEQ
jgi:hypothetical protein